MLSQCHVHQGHRFSLSTEFGWGRTEKTRVVCNAQAPTSQRIIVPSVEDIEKADNLDFRDLRAKRNPSAPTAEGFHIGRGGLRLLRGSFFPNADGVKLTRRRARTQAAVEKG